MVIYLLLTCLIALDGGILLLRGYHAYWRSRIRHYRIKKRGWLDVVNGLDNHPRLPMPRSYTKTRHFNANPFWII